MPWLREGMCSDAHACVPMHACALAQLAVHTTSTDTLAVTVIEKLRAFERSTSGAVQIDEDRVGSPLGALFVTRIDPGELPFLEAFFAFGVQLANQLLIGVIQ